MNKYSNLTRKELIQILDILDSQFAELELEIIKISDRAEGALKEAA
jgi:hypothetical protein